MSGLSGAWKFGPPPGMSSSAHASANSSRTPSMRRLAKIDENKAKLEKEKENDLAAVTEKLSLAGGSHTVLKDELQDFTETPYFNPAGRDSKPKSISIRYISNTISCANSPWFYAWQDLLYLHAYVLHLLRQSARHEESLSHYHTHKGPPCLPRNHRRDQISQVCRRGNLPGRVSSTVSSFLLPLSYPLVSTITNASQAHLHLQWCRPCRQAESHR